MPEVPLVEFVTEDEVAMPPLVGVAGPAVEGLRDHRGVRLRRHVDDVDPVGVRVDADLAAGVGEVGALIDDALRVVRVGRFDVATGEDGGCRRREVDEVWPAAAGAGADRVGEAALFIDDDVVGFAKAVEMESLFERHDARAVELAQLAEVEDLHAVASGLRHDERVVLVDLHVTPA